MKNQAAAALIILFASACDTDRGTPLNDVTSPAQARGEQQTEAPAPSGLVTLSQGGTEAEAWPYTSTGFSTSPQDPVNLVFLGETDPRQIRSTLMSLSGSGRPGPLAGFTCTWSDAVGDPQTSYSPSEGWVPSTIQMQCGNFFGPRFHLRMFRQGSVTLANAHYEILIPGTNMHEVLSWELAEGLVAADLARSGRLGAAPSPSQIVTAAPYYRAVQAPVAATLSASQIASLGLHVNTDGTASIPNDGRATMLRLASSAPVTEGMVDSNFVIQFGQVIPKPFCTAGTTGYLFATGPITVHMRSGIVDGNFESSTTSSGTLNLIEFNPITRQPAGAPYQGLVGETTSVKLTAGSAWVEFFSSREETPDTGVTRGVRVESLRAREHGLDSYNVDISC
ncbi:MAG TPA: hypothetical protein VJL35_11235 [Gemmatimonadaceae bacterium]|nr:hypothetical protein [Gemmatimonadaceae bacterium]